MRRGQQAGGRERSWRRVWLLPLLAFVGRRLALYLALYPIHLALAGVALAFVAIKASTGDTDAIFWLAYGWIALQVIVSPRLFVPNAVALAFLGLQATHADRDGWFWLCFAWLALMILGGGVLIRAARIGRRRAKAQAGAAAGPESIFASMFGGSGFSWPDQTAGADADAGADTLDGTAHEVSTDLADELERLAALRDSGALTSEEYARAKQKLLD